MFKRLIVVGALLLGLAMPTMAQAADKDGPTLMIRMQGVDRLLDSAEYVAKLAGQEDTVKPILAFVRLLGGEKGIEGVDTKNPFAIYANITEAIQDSQVVVMAPIADKDAFLGLLNNRLGIKPELKDGLYTVKAEQVPMPIFFRFANKYVYATVQDEKNIDEKKLPKPEDIMGKEPGVLSFALRVDRFPEQMKKFAMGQVEQMVQQAKQMPLPNETEAMKALKEKSIDSVMAGMKAMMFETKELILKADIQPKSEELSMEVEVTPVDGSSLSKDFASWKAAKSVIPGLLSGKDTAATFAMSIGLPSVIKKAMEPVIDEVVKMGLNMAPGEAQEIIDPLVKAIMPTLKAGEFDGGLGLYGPNAKEQYTVALAAKIKDGKDIEKAVKDAIKKAPIPGGIIVVDDETLGDFKLHTIKVGDFLDDNAKKIFGASNVSLAFRNDMVLICFGPDYKDVMKSLLNAKPAESSLAHMGVNAGKLIPIANASNPEAAKLAKELFGKIPNSETMNMSIEAGKSLKVRFGIKGQAIQFLARMGAQIKGN